MTTETSIQITSLDEISANDMLLIAESFNAIEPSVGGEIIVHSSAWSIESMELFQILWPLTLSVVIMGAAMFVLPVLRDFVRRQIAQGKTSKNAISN